MAGQAYPRWVRCKDGADRIVPDHIQHTALTGIEHGPDGKPVVVEPATGVGAFPAEAAAKIDDPFGMFENKE